MGKGDGHNRVSIPKIKHHSHLEDMESTQEARDILFVKYLLCKYNFTEISGTLSKQDGVSETFEWVNRTICQSGLFLNGNQETIRESFVMFDYEKHCL